jgi:short-subunit dehydrogenase
MPTLAIVGAGPGLGMSVARSFGRRGFEVALVARTPASLDALVARLHADGVTAAGFPADVTDLAAVSAAFSAIRERFGVIDVLDYAPAPRVDDVRRVHALEVTAADLRPTMEFMFYGALAATQQVLPSMLERGAGTLLYASGASSVLPIPRIGTFGPAGAALRQWVLMLHRSLAPRGVYAAHVAIGVMIGNGEAENDPDVIAERFWQLHDERNGPDHRYGTPPQEVLDAV